MYLEKQEIDEIFEKANHQAEIVLALYHKVHPDLDKIQRLEGYPRVSRELSTYLFEKFIEFDRKNHPDVMAGGMWMNKGFSTDESLEGCEVIPAVEVR